MKRYFFRGHNSNENNVYKKIMDVSFWSPAMAGIESLKLSFKSRPLLLFSSLILVILIPIYLLVAKFTNPSSEAAWFDESFQYRKAVDITNSSGGILTDFQVSISIGTSAPISAGKMKSDCSDIRITDLNGKILSHWIEENNPGCNAAADAKVWVKVPSIPTSGGILYVYYGNPNANNVADGNRVFIYFDDFKDANISAGKWTATGTGFTVTGGNLYHSNTLEPSALWPTYTYNSSSSFTDGVIESRMQPTSCGYSYGKGLSARHADDNNEYITGLEAWSGNYAHVGKRVGGYAGWSLIAQNALTCSTSTWYKIKWTLNGTNQTSIINGVTTSVTDSSLSSGKVGIEVDNNETPTGAYYDYFFVHKYAATEPSTTLSGTEEKSLGPVAYWKFDEGTGSTAYDSSSNKNNGTFLDAPVWKTEDQCVSGKCLAFDNVDDGVSINKNFAGLTDYTMSAWVNIKGNHRNYNGAIMSSGNWNTSQWVFGINQNNTAIDLYGRGTIAYNFNLNKWTHVVVTRNGNQYKVYVDGKIVSNYSGDPAALVSDAANTTIGRETYAGGYFAFNGWIDEPKIYSYTRTAAQIAADYNAGLARQSSAKGTSTNVGSPGASNLSNGLVGYWKMDETSGNALDSSGNNNTGTPTNTSIISGKFGNGRNFNGSGDTISIPHNSALKPSTYISISAWVKPTDIISGGYYEIYRKEDGNDRHLLSFQNSGTILSFGIGTATQGYQELDVPITSTNYTNGWHLITAVYDGQKKYLYRDGVQIGSQIATGAIGTGGGANAYIGSYGGGQEYFYGQIDEVRIYNRALSPKEVTDLYNFAPGPLMYWNLDEGSGSSINDKSGNNYNSTAFNNPTWTTGKFGKALAFDGNDVVNFNFIQTLPAMTISAWVNPSSYATWRAIVQTATSGDRALYLQNNALQMYNSCNSSVSVPLNTWTYVTTTVDSSDNVAYYINGVKAGGCVSSSSPRTIEYFHISGTGTGDGEDFQGKIDEVKIYNYVRTQGQVVSDMNAGHPLGGSPVGSQVGYWKMDEGYGSVANNSGSGGSAINGTISGATWTNNGKFGKALSFDGSNDYIYKTDSISSPLDVTNITLSAWIYPTIIDNQERMIFEKSYGDGWEFSVDQSGLKVNAKHGGVYESSFMNTNNNGIIVANRWQHVAWTYDGLVTKLFVNGNVVQTLNKTGDLAVNNGNLYISSRGGGYGFFQGIIDEPKIYNAALSDEEIKIDYNKGQAMVMGDESLSIVGSQNSPGASCATIKTQNSKARDGVYWIKPTGSTAAIQVYCDMTRDGGGWTLVLKSWHMAGIMGNAAAVGTIGDATTRKGNVYKMADTDIRNLIGPSQNFDIMGDQNGYNSYYSTGNYEYVIARNYTGYFRFDTAVAASTTTTVFQSYRLSDNALAWTGNLGCGYGGAGVNCYDVISNNPQGGAGCVINMGIASNVGWHHFYMSETNQDTYLFVCNGPQHSSSFDMNHRWWIRERSTNQSFVGDYPPIGEWNFNEGNGAIANDTSGNGNNGTWAGTLGSQWTEGKNGKAGNFNGASRVDLPSNPLNGATAGSWSFWIKWDINPASVHENVYIQEGSVWIAHYSGNLGIDISNGSWFDGSGGHNTGAIFPSNSFTDLKWHFVEWTFDGNYVRGYLDGKLSVGPISTGAVHSIADGYTPRDIGSRGTAQYLNGKVDDFRVYNYARTQAQVAWDYNKGAPVGWWKLDECQGGVAHDSSGNRFDGTISVGSGGAQTSAGTCTTAGTAWGVGSTGKSNASVNLDGTDDYIEIPTTVVLGNSGTISAWVKSDIWGAGNTDTVIDLYNSSNPTGLRDIFTIKYWNDKLTAMMLDSGGSWYSAGATVVYTTSQWYHVVIVRNSTSLKIYINGVEAGSATVSANNFYSFDRIRIGNSSVNEPWQGKIDDVRIYNYALTQNQIKQVYNGGAINFAPATGSP
jgi:hypothetical protein